ncbi:putative MFS transporter [Xylariales sp. PMI_506]|nr:putative MFS transporter [Xylariales sp. PMI_506]
MSVVEAAVPPIYENSQEGSVAYGDDDAIYNKFSRYKKIGIVALMSFYGFLSPLASISVLSATPELAASFETTESIINVSNAVYMVFMSISAPCWAPLSQVYGRRLVILWSGALFTVFSISNIFVGTLVAYFVVRCLVSFFGTSFLVIGASVVGDIYMPTGRGTALSWLLFGSVIGPALGPLIGGIIITFESWSVIFILQAALSGLALLLAVIFLPETIHARQDKELQGLPTKEWILTLWKITSPGRVVDLLRHPGLVIVSLASSSIIWNMYALLTPIRQVLNPRYHLSSPLQAALFYLAPGFGYLVGAAFGGRLSDYTVKTMIARSGGKRIPEGRLLATLIPLGVLMPGCILIYGWTVEKAVGGRPVPILSMFFQGIGQFLALPSLNTYCLDVIPGRSAEVIALNYMMRYLFAAGGTAAALPLINATSVGWFSTISSVFMVFTACLVAMTCRYGERWRQSRGIA